MSHEKSETIKKGGRWYNVDASGTDRGRILGNRQGYATAAEAVKAAKRRSGKYETRSGKINRRPKTVGEGP